VFFHWYETSPHGVHLLACQAQGQVCFRGRPTPQCRSFLVTEFGAGFRIGGDSKWPQDTWADIELGWMYNLSEKYAAGATGYMAFDPHYEDIRFGLKLRGRRWLNDSFSLNASGGALLHGGRKFSEDFPSFTGHVDLNYKDYVAPFVGVDVLRNEDGSHTHWHGGARFGYIAGSGMAVAAGAILVLATVAITGAG